MFQTFLKKQLTVIQELVDREKKEEISKLDVDLLKENINEVGF